MKRIALNQRKINAKDYKRRYAAESDYSQFISEPFLGFIGEEIKMAYKILDQDTSELITALQVMKYQESTRTDGLVSTSKIFGYSPKRLPYHDFCSISNMASEHPREHLQLCEWGQKIANEYSELCPKDFSLHEEITKKVSSSWKINGTPFTSGIINKDNQLQYHFDAGNFKKAKSCMIAFKHKVSGGHLSIPEYDLGVDIANNSLFIFDGAVTLHGVTPIMKEQRESYRYSIVYYSLHQMWKCMSADEELKRIREIKTKREFKRGGYVF